MKSESSSSLVGGHLMERKKQFERFTELLDRNTITPDKRLLIFLLSFLASSLILVNDPSSEGLVTIIFLIPFVILLLALSVLVRQQRRDRWRFQERKLFQSRWGTLGIAALGFGLGELIYHYRAWFRYWLDQLWGALRSIDQPEKLVLVSLFLLGVILGFFVVRNWSKNQQDFVTSITAVLGAAFLATILPA